jgi:hypothetical protein
MERIQRGPIMTNPASSDAKDRVASPAHKLPHERDETHDGTRAPDKPEIQKAFDAVQRGHGDTSKGEQTDRTYNEGVVGSGARQSGTASAHPTPDPAAKK